ncbi:MAG: tRNA (adenosine(37)-N6)-dimethylallyltransferase MiaA [Pseudomonadota bacterium]
MNVPPVLLLVGPTASGKTALAMALADERPVRLINMDSAQVYRGMDVGTAKPSPAELERYPHALLDICDPAEAYSAARFVADADAEVRAALAADQLPVLVGGTMLYGRAFTFGLTTLPAADPALRAAIEAEAEQRGWPALHAELAAVDPDAAAGIHPHNRQRLQRALEVYRQSGRPLSAWWREQDQAGATARLGVRPVVAGLVVSDRARLHERINARFAAMLAGGLIEEVRALRDRGDLHLDLPALRAVGYRQVWEHLDGAYDAAMLKERGSAATRQLAKRQLTWMRSWQALEPLAAEPLWDGSATAITAAVQRLLACLAI